MDYTAEQASTAMAEWTDIHERLARGFARIEVAMDLKRAVSTLARHQRRLVRQFIENSHRPATLGGRFVEPIALLQEARELEEIDQVKANMLVATVKEIRACRAVAVGMSGRRARAPIRVPVDRRLRGRSCARCGEQVGEGAEVFWDRDFGGLWHVECSS